MSIANIDNSPTSVNFKLKPEILTHPNIPKPLHGISPRTIMGREWWDITRKATYAKYGYHCVACGVSKTNAKMHQWLEAHEFWSIDYNTGICEIKSIEPLCHYCHNFIHSGRLSEIIGKEKTEQDAVDVLEHGFKILSENNLECFRSTLYLAKNLNANTFGVKAYELSALADEFVKWEDWKLLWNGNEYKSKFASYQDWASYYEKF